MSGPFRIRVFAKLVISPIVVVALLRLFFLLLSFIQHYIHSVIFDIALLRSTVHCCFLANIIPPPSPPRKLSVIVFPWGDGRSDNIPFI